MLRKIKMAASMEVASSPPLRTLSQPVETKDLMKKKDTEDRCLAVLTSGGDSQGMNAAVRAVVRIALFKGMKPYLVNEGYKGLVEGGELIKECQWTDVTHTMHKGGTIIGTARCKEFRERSGRLDAAANLVKARINNLVIIGGDGSLTGANIFKEEWKGLLEELVRKERITQEEAALLPYLNIVGLVGSIDNDMCGTDMTIGTDSALHRIIEAMDCLVSTASSHQRTFVLEIMGRNCGYLTIMAGIAVGAEWVLIPENPPKEGWEESMCDKLKSSREKGRRLNFILVAEGAIDQENKKITTSDVKKVIDSKLGFDTRVTVLGHVQRGGRPSAYDRILGTRMGAAAVQTLFEAKGEMDAFMIAIRGNEMTKLPLMSCVETTKKIGSALNERDFNRMQELRGSSFARNIKILKKLEACPTTTCKPESSPSSPSYTFAVMNVGAPAGGTNSCTRSFVRFLLYSGHTVLGIYSGFDGLKEGEIKNLDWSEVSEWGSVGGSKLGTTRTVPDDKSLDAIAKSLESHGIQGLLVVGGFEAFQSLIKLEEGRRKYPALCIPIVQVAATISNNVPGTEYSLGCDTALNVIVSACDILKQSATASRKRVFVVETMGGYCGYLATMGALAGGADSAYIFEESFNLDHLRKDVAHMVHKFKAGNFEKGIIMRNESCNNNYTTDFMTQMLAEEGKDYFIARSSVLGHLQQGDAPSPFDRILGTKYAYQSMNHLLECMERSTTSEGKVLATGSDTICVMGLVGVEYKPTPVSVLKDKCDMKYRIPNDQWWIQLRPLVRILARHADKKFHGETDMIDDDTRSKEPHPPQFKGLSMNDVKPFLPPLLVLGAMIAMTFARLNNW
ncbi:PREDICTED: ATP-dependent 6-phosphofructokinase, muscle type-like [Amphimedon queenslandica]|uniref:6-phosphofructokinase n=1 Tax=Amphimedon queenslandica TaxID=400682 RepID=A0A1X7V043_AMPQE|nr:PREDICTED: ATP-dependent 6-phosphofructokinase, muscle type-like [Amphimedon queenslandica]|eukprot:XP_003386247.2 PREDICTED: ATP-dependent 6-phosphofructokinase, muscle type-like [Amphimedon queenslandica]